jgi:DNA-binding NtrC family response regulator
MSVESREHGIGKQLVVIDAEPVVRSVVKDILESKGYSVTVTDDVEFAIQLCKANSPDLVLTNVFLPGITGHDAMKMLKESCPNIPVLMISGLPDSDTVQEWIKQDGFDAFPKPFRPNDLIVKVDEMMAKRHN